MKSARVSYRRKRQTRKTSLLKLRLGQDPLTAVLNAEDLMTVETQSITAKALVTPKMLLRHIVLFHQTSFHVARVERLPWMHYYLSLARTAANVYRTVKNDARNHLSVAISVSKFAIKVNACHVLRLLPFLAVVAGQPRILFAIKAWKSHLRVLESAVLLSIAEDMSVESVAVQGRRKPASAKPRSEESNL